MDISLSRFINCNLTGCNFSYSNLWGVSFRNCKLINTKFIQAECLCSEFIDNDISEDQLKEMLFIDKYFFTGFSENREGKEALKYSVVYSKNKSCFINRSESEKFVNFKNKTEQKKKINFLDTIRLLLYQEFFGKKGDLSANRNR